MFMKRAIGPVDQADFFVPTMVCDGCADRMRTVLKRIPGVRQVRPSVWRKRVVIRYEAGQVSEDQLRSALDAAGFPPAASG